MDNRLDDAKEQLKREVENWYRWLSAEEKQLFSSADKSRMLGALRQFKFTADFISDSAIARAEQFIAAGGERMIERLVKGDYSIHV